MRNLIVLLLCYWIFNCYSVIYSQKLSVGISSGINISDIHRNDNSGKWKFKPGPAQVFFLNYKLSDHFGLKTGLNYSALYYEKVNYTGPYLPYYLYNPYSPSSIWQGYYYEVMDFTFLTLPFQISLSIPSTPRITISTGIYYSFLIDNSVNPYEPWKYYGGFIQNEGKDDYGYMWSAGISYPLNEKLSTHFEIDYLTGRQQILFSRPYKHGSVDFTFGLSYGFLTKNKKNSAEKSLQDSALSRVSLSLTGGINVSWNGGKYFGKKYSATEGLSLGFLADFKLLDNYSLQTGLSFERMGYTFSDSSKSFYRYVPKGFPLYNVDTRMRIDYIMIPVLNNFYFGQSESIYFNTGPYLGIKLNAICTGSATEESRPDSKYEIIKTTVYDDVEGLIKNNDFGWIFGAGYSISISHKYEVDIGIQYRTGLIDVLNKTFLPEPNQKKIMDSFIQNRVFAFKIGVTLPYGN